MSKLPVDLASVRRAITGAATSSGAVPSHEALLDSLAARFTTGIRLTPAERAEIVHIARGFASKDSAAAGDLADETVRARRKRIYKKLRVTGASELISTLLAFALGLLARGEPLEVTPPGGTEPPPDTGTATG